MGSLSLPDTGSVYLDTNGFIYSVEHLEPYYSLLVPLWTAANAGLVEIMSSELVILETLVKPLRAGDEVLAELFRNLFRSREVRLLPATQPVWTKAAELRARYTGLKTPDALHAATALEYGSMTFLTNDSKFRQVSDLRVQLLSEHLG